VRKPQGRRGEVMADLHTSFPERFAERKSVWLLGNDGGRREAELEAHWLHKGGIVLKFAGVDSITAAEALAGAEVQIARSERVELADGEAYISDLVGCRVIDEIAGELGVIEVVQFGAGEAPLLVVRRSNIEAGAVKKEFLVPFAQEFLREMDAEKKILKVKLPEGLADLE
jgi:16S rRNA processing protein RimM